MKQILAASILTSAIFFQADKGGETATEPAPPFDPTLHEIGEEDIEIKLLAVTFQPRVGLDQEVIDGYAQVIKESKKAEQPNPFPPIIVFRDELGHLRVADGCHRLPAHKKAGEKSIACRLYKGGDLAAKYYAITVANRTHGIQRSNRDKIRAVKAFFAEFPEMAKKM